MKTSHECSKCEYERKQFMSRMSPRVVLQGQVLNRNTMVREDFVTVCDTKQHFNQEIQRIYTSIKDFPEFTITVAIRQTKN